MTCMKCDKPVRCRGLCKIHYERSRRLLSFTTEFVDAEPVREHLAALMSAGMGQHRIAEVSGIRRATVRGIMLGTRGRPPCKRVVRRNAEKLLAVKLDLAGGVAIDGLGSTRRLQALVAIGYTQTYLAERLGWQVSNLGKLTHGQRKVTTATAKQISALYDELSMKPGPSEGARNYARRRHWPAPLAWDDIDDPQERPQRTKRTVVRWDEKFYELRALGYSDMEITRRLGIHPDSVLRQMARYNITPSPQMVRYAQETKYKKASA